MQIRKKLTFQFVLIVASIFFLSLVSIYYFSANYRRIQFKDHLIKRANRTIQLLFNIEEVGPSVLKIIDRNNPGALYNENIAVYDNYHHLIYCNNDTNNLIIKPSLIEKVKKEKKFFLTQKDFEIMGLEYLVGNHNYIVFAAATDKSGINKMNNLWNILLVVFTLGILITLTSGWFYAGKALSPISKMITQADRISISNINLRLDEGEQEDELSNLAHTFNKMLQRLENAIMLQKKFVANASHELRTPLTAIMGQLEVSLMKDRVADYYKDKISSILEDIKILIQTTNQLLIFTQVISDESDIVFTPLHIDELILQTRSELASRNPDYIVELYLDDLPNDEDELLVLSHEVLLKTAFRNLLENACKYSENKKVFWNVEFIDNMVILKFIDEGIGISPEDMEHIFQPFYRGINSKKDKGSGLGLSIVEKIISLHKGTIEVTSKLGKGTTFLVTLPTISA